MKIFISKEDDRITVAGLLVKNGYAVRIGKEPAKTGGKTVRHFVETVQIPESDGKEE